MAEEIGGAIDGGTVEIKVAADLSEFEAQRLQREVDTRVERVRAEIKAKVDATRVQAEAEAAARSAEQVAKVKTRMVFEKDRVRKEVQDAVRQAEQDAKVQVTPEVDKRGLIQRWRDAMAALRGEPPVEVPVGADPKPAEEETERTRRKVTSKPWEIALKVGSVAAIATGIASLIGMLGQLAGGLFAVAAAGGQAIGVLGALPGVAATAGQGLAGLLVGLHGVGAALGALAQRDKQAASSGASAAAAREAAAAKIKAAEEQVKAAKERAKAAEEAVTEARRRAAETERSVADRAVAAAQKIADAQWREQQSHKATQRAQEALTKAREDAIHRIRDLQLAVQGGALDEESARIAIERAKLRLQKVSADPWASDLDKREADLAFRQAEQRLKEIQNRNKDLREEESETTAKGVEGSDQVKAAKESLLQAEHSEIAAVRELAEARKDADRQHVEGLRAIAEAQKAILKAQQAERDARAKIKDAKANLAKAKQPAKSGGGGGVDPVQEALDALTPRMREFVLFLHDTVMPELSRIRKATQEALAPGLMAGVKAAMPFLDTLRVGLAETGTVIGGVATRFGELLGGKQFNLDVSTIMAANNQAMRAFGDAGVAAFSALTSFMVIASPYVTRMADALRDMVQRFDGFTKSADGQERIAGWLERAWEAGSRLWRIVKGLTAGLLSLGKAAAPSGNTLLEDMAQGAERFAKWAADPGTQAKAKEWFDSLVPVMREAGGLFKDIGGLFKDLAGNLDPDTTTGFLSFLRDVVGFLRTIAQSDFAGGAISSLVGPLGMLLAVVAKFGGLGAAAGVLGAVLKSPITAVKAGIGAGNFVGGLFGKDTAGAAAGAGRAVRSGVGAVGRGVGTAAKATAGAVGSGASAVKGALTSLAQSQGWDVLAGSLAGKVKTALGKVKVNTANMLSKVNPKTLLAKTAEKIDISGWFSKVNPKSLVSKAGEAASGIGGALAEAGGKLGGLAKDGGKAVSGWARKGAEEVGKFASSFGDLAKKVDLARVRQIAAAAATGVIKVATTAWTAAQTALNFVLNANPIGLIVLAIAALVAGVIWAYNNVGWFRDLCNAAFKAIGAVASWLWNNALKPAFDWIASFVTNTLGPAVSWLWAKVFKPALDAIGQGSKVLWQQYLKPALEWVVSFIQTKVAPVVSWLYNNVFKPAWDKIGEIVSFVWNKVLKPGFEALVNFVTKTIPDAFDKGVSLIKKFWDGLKKIAAAPVDFVVNTVYMKGIKPVWDFIAGKVGMDPLPAVTFKGFATGGPVYGPGGPRSDSIPAMLSNGEYVVNAAQTKRWFWLIDAINRGVLPGFAGGGGVGGLLATVGDLLKKGAGVAARAALLPLRGAIDGGVGSTGLGRLLGGIPRAAIDKLLSYFDAQDQAKKTKRAGGGLIGGMPSYAFAGGGSAGAAAMFSRTSRARTTSVDRPSGRDQRPIQVHVYPAPGMNEHELAVKVGHEIGKSL
ncbi:hypothetical protein ACQP25_44470 (plasmid) [Microtetraspora malaysiensis]|uniref:hypothetical protein n=1 Tax=Microtetraspora malaysiensis TaxID=161358 RepID=UPI003D905738